MKKAESGKGVVCAGHEETARAGAEILAEGGNAFDAILAAHSAACVCEPALASLGGGGYLLAVPAAGEPVVYDFFVQTPSMCRNAEDIDFHPIHTDFGSVAQEFHIGVGSAAVPGTVAGLFSVHRDLCTFPTSRLFEPGIRLAREGVRQSAFQAYVFRILSPILTASKEARAIYAPTRTVCPEGAIFRNTDLVTAFEALSREGEFLFYGGEIGEQIVALSHRGGCITRNDLTGYGVKKRAPVVFDYRGTRILTNPPPSSGGALIGFALGLLENLPLAAYGFGSFEHLQAMAVVMEQTNEARREVHGEGRGDGELDRFLDRALVDRYRREVAGRVRCSRGTTHMSVIDAKGNMAGLSVSNGEGCGHVIPGTGVMLNNMLGEEDLNPAGFHRWPGNVRMTSMMAPTAAFWPDGRRLIIGSGGSNRLRTAILQVLVNLIEMKMPLEEAVRGPRLHWEGGRLLLEGGFAEAVVENLVQRYPDFRLWEGLNLFFGGTHGALSHGLSFEGAGDPRRDGRAIVVA